MRLRSPVKNGDKTLFTHTGWSKKTDIQFNFWDNFGNSEPILTIISLLHTEIYGALSKVLTTPLSCDHITQQNKHYC